MKNMAKCGWVSWLSLCILAGCGGGGGTIQQQQTPTTAVVKVSTEGSLPQDSSIAGMGVTVNLPVGLTVKTDPNGAVNAGVVIPSGVAGQATVLQPVYTPASSSTTGRLSFVLASTQANGFGLGEFVTINCDISAGASPHATDVRVTDLKPVDLRARDISGLRATFTFQTQ